MIQELQMWGRPFVSYRERTGHDPELLLCNMGLSHTSDGQPPMAVDAVRDVGGDPDVGLTKKLRAGSLSPVARSIDQISCTSFAVDQPRRPSGPAACFGKPAERSVFGGRRAQPAL